MDNTYESRLTKLRANDRQARRAALDYWYALGALVLELRDWRRSPGRRTPYDLAEDLSLPVEELLRAKAFFVRYSDTEIERLVEQHLGWEYVRELALCPEVRIRTHDFQKKVASGQWDLSALKNATNINWATEQLKTVRRYRKQSLRVQRRNAGIPLTPRKSRKRSNSVDAVA